MRAASQDFGHVVILRGRDADFGTHGDLRHSGKTLANNQFCGTSAAVPSIAGAAALLESAGFNRAQVLKALRGTAVPLGPAAWDPGYGFGLADAAAALHSGGN